MCGEKTLAVQSSNSHQGSPPHVRGKASSWIKEGTENRITPACAGKSAMRVVLQLRLRDHPRMCGEKKSAINCGSFTLGSPPHVRGKVQQFGKRRAPTGITPACAGKSCRCSRPAPDRWDHPRMCGEKQPGGEFVTRAEGSPPHVRGKDDFPHGAFCHVGITPACAGKSGCGH